MTDQSNAVIFHPRFGPSLPSRGWIPAPRYLLRRARALRLIADLAPTCMLDIGCGPGALLVELQQKGIECHGLETSSAALTLGHELHRNNDVRLHNRPSDEWRGKFDLVTAFEILEHIEQDVEALQQWREWIRPGGHLIISVPAHPRLWNARDVWAGHVRRYTRTELLDKTARADLEVRVVECYGFPIANVLELVSALAHRRLAKTIRHPEPADMGKQTANSGIDRSLDLPFWRIFALPPVALAFDIMANIQNLTLTTNLGNGFIVVARKPPH